MDARRAQDLLRHIAQDNDYGAAMLIDATISETMEIVNELLPGCVNAAVEKGNENDEGYYKAVMNYYRPFVAEKIRNAEHLWIAYSEHTGYPYIIDGDLFVIYDYEAVKEIKSRLDGAGYMVSIAPIDADILKAEVSHMYRNGYRNIRFTNGKGTPYIMSREELYPYESFFTDNYVTNPGLQLAMIDYFQELRKLAPAEGRDNMLKQREDAMFNIMVHSEFMVPCEKEETDDSIEISHPFVDLTDKVTDKKDDEKVIAIPVFTDGYEMEKCYEGHYENMLYKFSDLLKLTDELQASGILINAFGVSYFMDRKTMKIVGQRI